MALVKGTPIFADTLQELLAECEKRADAVEEIVIDYRPDNQPPRC